MANGSGNSNGSSPFGIHLDQRVTFFIEGANLYSACRAAELDIDYRRMLAHFDENCNFKRGYYYTAVAEDSEYNSIKPLLDFLQYNGYTLVTKPLKEYTDPSGRRKVKGSLDVEISIDVLNACTFSDHIVLFSGDSDFTALVREVQRKGVKMTVVSLKSTTSDELRRQADAFVDVDDREVRSVLSKIDHAPRDRLPPEVLPGRSAVDAGSTSHGSTSHGSTSHGAGPSGPVSDNGQRPGVAPRTPPRRIVGTVG